MDTNFAGCAASKAATETGGCSETDMENRSKQCHADGTSRAVTFIPHQRFTSTQSGLGKIARQHIRCEYAARNLCRKHSPRH